MKHKMSMDEIWAQSDFEEAVDRLNSCQSNRWRNQWWELVVELFAEHRSTLAGTWQVDPVNKVVRHRQLEEEHHFAYFEGLFDSTEEKVFDKVGTSDNPLRRWWENLHTAGYAKAFDLTTDEIYRCWDCQSIPSEGLESYLRAMLIAKYRGKNYYPNDRFYFKDGEFTPPTMEEIDHWANTYQRMCGLL